MKDACKATKTVAGCKHGPKCKKTSCKKHKEPGNGGSKRKRGVEGELYYSFSNLLPRS